MRKKLNKRKQDLPLTTKNLIGIFLSSIIGVIIAFITTVIISLILKNSAFLPKSISALFVISIVIGAFITGFIASKKCSFKGLISGLISSIPYLFIITIIMLFFSHGKLTTSMLFLYIGGIISSALGGIISANTKRRK